MNELKASHTQAGLLMTAATVPGIIFGIPAGIATKKYGMKKTATFSAMLVALGSFITSLALSFNLAIVGRIILGIGGSFLVTVMPAMISQWFSKKELGKAVGIYGINMPIATITAFPIASYLSLNYGWRHPIMVSGIVSTIATGVLAALAQEGPVKVNSNPQKLNQALTNIELWKVGLIWLFFNAAALSFTTWMPKLLEDLKGMESIQASMMASMLMVAAIPSVPFFGLILDKLKNQKAFMIIGLGMMSFSILSIAYLSRQALLIPFIIAGIGASMVPPAVMASPPKILKPSDAELGFGILTMCMNAGVALGPPILGLILDLLSYYSTTAFLAIGVLAAIGMMIACIKD
jgi:predicted MFS family arabinose efflux permease